MMKKKVLALCVVMIALLPLFFIMPTMTGSSPRVPTDLYIGGLRGTQDGPIQPSHPEDPGPHNDVGVTPTNG